MKGFFAVCVFLLAITFIVDAALAEAGIRRAIGLALALTLFGSLVWAAVS